MSSYLIPRAKPNTLGRLIVDYSPINPLIESPASVIPEIGATLQFLQGKALYSSLDLRQAYLALRIDEPSKPLTTFLTPSGAFVWNSLTYWGSKFAYTFLKCHLQCFAIRARKG